MFVCVLVFFCDEILDFLTLLFGWLIVVKQGFRIQEVLALTCHAKCILGYVWRVVRPVQTYPQIHLDGGNMVGLLHHH